MSLSQLFLQAGINLLQASISKFVYALQIEVKLISENTENLFFVLLSAKKGWMNKLLIVVFIAFLVSVPTFMEMGLVFYTSM